MNNLIFKRIYKEDEKQVRNLVNLINKYSGKLKWDSESKEMKFFEINNLPKNQNDIDLIEIYIKYINKN